MADDPSRSSEPGIIPCSNDIPLFLKRYVEGQELPPTLSELYSNQQVKTEFHAFCVVIHNLMLESGYVLKDNSPSSFQITNLLVNFSYVHPSCSGMGLTLACNPIGPFVSINGMVYMLDNETDGKFIATQVRIADHVKFSAHLKPSDGKNVYRNLSKLSHNYKKTLAHKALDMMREEMGLPPLHGILSLYPELLQNIFCLLDVKSLVNLSMTCQRMYNLTSDNNLWKAFFIRDFGGRPTQNVQRTWKEKYKFQYNLRREMEKEQERNRRRFENPNPFATPNPGVFPGQGGTPFAPMPGHPLGVIGGDYDLNPDFGPFGRGEARRSSDPTRSPAFPRPRYDPFGPDMGNFRPGRGGGMMDPDLLYDDGSPQMPGQPPFPLFGRGRGRGGGFGHGSGFGGFGGGGFM